MNQDQPPLFPTAPEAGIPLYSPEDFPFFHGAQYLAEAGVIDPSWVPTLAPLDDQLHALATELSALSHAGKHILPEPKLMLRALEIPVDHVKVLIIGQDPYPTPGHANGLSFATNVNVQPIPRSLKNIYRELQDDLGVAPASHGDLSAWQKQGVMMLNQSLSVTAASAGSHQRLGWTTVTEAIIKTLNARQNPVIAVLWGAHAQRLVPQMPEMIRLCSPHPSPLSASRGFFGSHPFSAVNRYLEQMGQPPIDWKLPPA